MLLSASVDFKDEDDEEEGDGEVDTDKRIRSFRAAKEPDDNVEDNDDDGSRSIHPVVNKGNKMMHNGRSKLMEPFTLIVSTM